ncbi:transglutaminase domain-containing protein [Fibrella aquatica]|jgi:transglutaminase/protease-like cytokinesis protein 3|uniref:transglutaminase domain-containing protein n=1 Tax=Fibrella aquatica TaxID=3242487 RepID=UPI0035220792
MRKYTLPAIVAAFLLAGTTALTPRTIPNSVSVTTLAPNEYEAIDTYARRTPEAHAKDLKTLSAYLTAPARSDLAKARSVYAWILSHVKYDLAVYSGSHYSSETYYASRILQSRRAVCSGFAMLYKHLLNQAGVEVTTVKGYARYTDAQAGYPTGGIDHEWNAVKLDGDWYLIDLTWASTTAQKGVPNDFYFLTDPQAFISQHLPLDSRWQLLSRAVTKADFDRFPKYYDAYFNLGFTPYFPKQGIIRGADNVTLDLANEGNVEFWCAVGPRGGRTHAQVKHSVTRSGGNYQLNVNVPRRGAQTLYIFAKQKASKTERYKQYAAIASFTVL